MTPYLKALWKTFASFVIFSLSNYSVTMNVRTFKRLNVLTFLFALIAVGILVGCTGRNIIPPGAGWTAAVVDQNMVFVGTMDGDVVALNAENGQTLWRFSPSQDQRTGGVYGTPEVGDALIYVGGNNGKLYALRKDAAELEWQQSTHGAIISGPVLVKEQGMVLVGSNDGKLYAFNASDGTRLWSFQTDDRVWSTPTVSRGRIYFGSMDHYIYALSMDGKQLWRYNTGGAVVSRPLVLDGMVIVGSFDRKLYVLDESKGDLLWSFRADRWFWASPVSNGNTIFVPAMDGKVYALDTKGGLQWAYSAKGPVVSTPLVLGDKIVVATDAGRLSLLRAKDGEELWSFFDVRGKVRAPLINIGSLVFVGALDGKLYKINVDKGTQEWAVSTKRER